MKSADIIDVPAGDGAGVIFSQSEGRPDTAPLPVSQTADATIVRSQIGSGTRKKSAPGDEFSPEQVNQLRRNPPPYTTLPEIAIVLQVSQRTVMRYAEDRRIPVMNRGKHALLFNTRKVLEALERCS